MNDRHSNLGTTRPEYGLIPCVSPRALGGRPLRPLQRLSVRHAGPDGARLPLLLGSMVKTQRPVAPSLHVAHAPPGKKHSHTLLTYYYYSLPRCGWHMTPPRGGDPASLASQPLPFGVLELEPPPRSSIALSLTPRLGARLRQTRAGWHRMLLPRLLERVRAHAQAALRLHRRARRAAVLLSVAS